MTNTITIVAYKPDGVDTCRGCVMATYQSSFDMETFEEIKDAAQFFARKEHENKHRDDQRAPDWQLIVMINGKVADYNDLCNPSIELTEPEEGLFNLFKPHVLLAEADLERDREVRLAEQAKNDAAARQAHEAAAKERRRRQFEDLKQEFGHG